MSKIKRKGFSNILTSIVLVLLSIVAVSMVSLSINKIIEPQFSPQFSCFDMQTFPPAEITNTCFDSGNVEITIKRDFNSNITSLDFNIITPTQNYFGQVGEECDQCEILEKGAVETYYFPLEDFEENSEVKLSIDNCLIDEKEITRC